MRYTRIVLLLLLLTLLVGCSSKQQYNAPPNYDPTQHALLIGKVEAEREPGFLVFKTKNPAKIWLDKPGLNEKGSSAGHFDDEYYVFVLEPGLYGIGADVFYVVTTKFTATKVTHDPVVQAELDKDKLNFMPLLGVMRLKAGDVVYGGDLIIYFNNTRFAGQPTFLVTREDEEARQFLEKEYKGSGKRMEYRQWIGQRLQDAAAYKEKLANKTK